MRWRALGSCHEGPPGLECVLSLSEETSSQALYKEESFVALTVLDAAVPGSSSESGWPAVRALWWSGSQRPEYVQGRLGAKQGARDSRAWLALLIAVLERTHQGPMRMA